MKRNNFRYSALFHFNRSRNKTNFARSEKIHFDAKQWTDPNFRINKIGFSIHHSGKRAFRSVCAVGVNAYVIRKSRSCNGVPQRRAALKHKRARKRRKRQTKDGFVVLRRVKGDRHGGDISVPFSKLFRLSLFLLPSLPLSLPPLSLSLYLSISLFSMINLE